MCKVTRMKRAFAKTKLAWASSIVGSALVVSGHAYANCNIEKVAEFDVNLEAKRPLMAVAINGQQGWMMFSNRSNVTTLYKVALEKLSLKPYTTTFYTNVDGKEVPIYGTHIEHFQIGNEKPASSDLFVADVTPHTDAWGVISTSWFPGSAVEFDFSKKKITLYHDKYCVNNSLIAWDKPPATVDLMKDDLASFLGEIGGKPIWIQINTGQRYSSINMAAVSTAGLILKDDPVRKPSAPTSGKAAEIDPDGYLYKIAIISKIVIAGEVMTNVAIRAAPNPSVPTIPGHPLGGSRVYDGPLDTRPKIVLGSDYLLTHHVIISPNQRVAYITATGGPPFETDSDDIIGGKLKGP